MQLVCHFDHREKSVGKTELREKVTMGKDELYDLYHGSVNTKGKD